MKVSSRQEAWREADRIFNTDYMKDDAASANAGYPVYWSTADGVNAWISDLGDRLEVNQDGRSVNIWIEESSEEQPADAETVKTEKTIHMYFETTTMKRGTEVTVKMSPSITFGVDTSFRDILGFMEDAKRLHRAAMKAIEEGNAFYWSITESKYKWTGDRLETTASDSWIAADVSRQDTEGVYFNPDTRYTEAHRDMYLEKGALMKDLAAYLN